MKKAANKRRRLVAKEPGGHYSASHKRKKSTADADMLDEYDFSKGIRGKYTQRYAEGTNIVVLDPELAKLFPDSISVNRALRKLAEIIRQAA